MADCCWVAPDAQPIGANDRPTYWDPMALVMSMPLVEWLAIQSGGANQLNSTGLPDVCFTKSDGTHALATRTATAATPAATVDRRPLR